MNSFIHGVVNSPVRFDYPVSDLIIVTLDQVCRTIGTPPVDDDLFKIGESLVQDAINGLFKTVDSVKTNGDH